MMLSLQKISASIPAPSAKVKYFFDQSVTPNTVSFGIFARYVKASVAISASAVNTLGYGLVIISRVPIAFIYRDFTNITKNCRQDASHVFQSFYFCVAMSTYLFMSIIPRSGYKLYLEPPIDPYLFTPEFRAPVLLSNKPLEESIFKLCDRKELETTDVNLLLRIVHRRPGLVLVVTSDKTHAYLVKRDDSIRALVTNGTLTFDALSLIAVPKPIPAPEVDLEPPALFPSVSLESTPPPSPKAVVPKEQEHDPADDLIQDFYELPLGPSLNPHTEEIIPRPLSTVEHIKMTLASAWGEGYNHPAKEIKYRHILDHFYKVVTIGKGLELYNSVYRTQNSPLKTQCLKLYEIITNLESVDIRQQYADFIYALREAQTLLQGQDDNKACKEWIHLLAMHRFAGIRLYGYCKSLVELASKERFTDPVNLENFWGKLQGRLSKIKKISADQGLAIITRAWQKCLGELNLKDFLIASNIPYIYGQLKMGEQVVTILRHGTPIALSGGYWKRSQVTEDYEAFVDAANEKNEKILHLIAENLQDPFEGVRVQARLALASKQNFFPWAIRFDGDFIEQKNYKPKTVKDTKTEFLAQMYGVNTGYSVPEKLRQNGLSEKEFIGYMESVERTFFHGRDKFETREEFQAFVVLTYAEAVLSLCKKLNISYLEALCKDDIDRGGAMKAIIVLLHLYKTGKFAKGREEELHQALEELMVNIIAAPLIVKKQPILKHRAAFIENVLEMMKRTIAIEPIPHDMHAGNFNILSEPHQRITPIGSSCRTEKEYKAYLLQVRNGDIVLKTTLDQNIVQLSAQNKKRLAIQHQLERDITGLNMYLNELQLNPGRKLNSDIQPTILSALGKSGIKDDEAWSVLSAFTQTIGSDLIASLQPLFNNDGLGYIISPDTKEMQTDENSGSGLYLTTEQNKASIKLVMLCKIISPDNGKSIASIRTTIEIPDHKVAGATVTTTVV